MVGVNFEYNILKIKNRLLLESDTINFLYSYILNIFDTCRHRSNTAESN